MEKEQIMSVQEFLDTFKETEPKFPNERITEAALYYINKVAVINYGESGSDIYYENFIDPLVNIDFSTPEGNCRTEQYSLTDVFDTLGKMTSTRIEAMYDTELNGFKIKISS